MAWQQVIYIMCIESGIAWYNMPQPEGKPHLLEMKLSLLNQSNDAQKKHAKAV